MFDKVSIKKKKYIKDLKEQTVFGKIKEEKNQSIKFQINQYGKENILNLLNCKTNAFLQTQSVKQYNQIFKNQCLNNYEKLLKQNKRHIQKKITINVNDLQNAKINFNLIYEDLNSFQANYIFNLGLNNNSIMNDLANQNLIQKKQYSIEFENNKMSLILGSQEEIQEKYYQDYTIKTFKMEKNEWTIDGLSLYLNNKNLIKETFYTKFDINQEGISLPKQLFQQSYQLLKPHCQIKQSDDYLHCNQSSILKFIVNDQQQNNDKTQNTFQLDNLFDKKTGTLFIKQSPNNQITLGRKFIQKYHTIFDQDNKQIKIYIKDKGINFTNENKYLLRAHQTIVKYGRFVSILVAIVFMYLFFILTYIVLHAIDKQRDRYKERRFQRKIEKRELEECKLTENYQEDGIQEIEELTDKDRQQLQEMYEEVYDEDTHDMEEEEKQLG